MSRNRAPHASSRRGQALGADLLRLGSAGAKTMAVVTGDADIYAHAGGMYEWDSCRAGGGGGGRRPARQPHRRLAAAVQPARSVAARPARLPARTGDGR